MLLYDSKPTPQSWHEGSWEVIFSLTRNTHSIIKFNKKKNTLIYYCPLMLAITNLMHFIHNHQQGLVAAAY